MERLNSNTKILVFILTLSLSLASTRQSDYSEWDFDCTTLNERHLHELICSRYYQCTEDDVGNWVIELNSCPPGRIYNEVSGRCEDGQCPTEPPPCLRFSLDHEIFTGSRNWNFQCHALKERYQHESFCYRYYECNESDVGDWIIQVHSCPPGRIYDEAEGRCIDGSCPTAPPPDCETKSTDANTQKPSTISPDPLPSTIGPEPSTISPDPSPSTIGPEPSTISPDPSLSTIGPEPSTISPDPSPSTTDPEPPTISPDPSPSTIGPEPSTINPDPSTIATEQPVSTVATPGFKCTVEGVFPDPWDCKLSHTCIESGGGLIDVPVRCPDDTNFCPDEKACGDCPCST